jgi:hypothetical protein
MVQSPIRKEASKIREYILNGDAAKAEELLSGLYEKSTGIEEVTYLDFVKSTLEVVKSNEKDWSTETDEYLKKRMLRKIVEEYLERAHALYLPRINRVRLPQGGHLALIDFENDISRLKKQKLSFRKRVLREFEEETSSSKDSRQPDSG